MICERKSDGLGMFRGFFWAAIFSISILVIIFLCLNVRAGDETTTKPVTTTWIEKHNKFSIKLQNGKGIEFGLRSDGVVIWREEK